MDERQVCLCVGELRQVEQPLAGFVKRTRFQNGRIDAHFFDQQPAHRVIGVHLVREQRHQAADAGRCTDLQRIFREHADSVRHQVSRYLGALPVLADQHGDFLVIISFCAQSVDVFDHPAERSLAPGARFVRGEEGQAHITRRIRGVRLGNPLLRVAVDAADLGADICQVSFRGEGGAYLCEKGIVEVHDGRAAAPVFL